MATLVDAGIGTIDSPICDTGRTRKCFYAQGRRWVFYIDNADYVWKSAGPDYVWSAKQNTNVPPGVWNLDRGTKGTCWYSATQNKVYLAAARGAAGDGIWFRSGTPQSDGSITWTAPWVAAVVAARQSLYPCICVDTDGYVWISYYYSADGTSTRVTRSGNNDGTWGITPPGFPYTILTGPAWRSACVPMTAGKIAVFAACPNNMQRMKCQIWTGAAWLPLENVANLNVSQNNYVPVIAVDDDLFVMAFRGLYPNTHTSWSYRLWSAGVWANYQEFEAGILVGQFFLDVITKEIYYFYDHLGLPRYKVLDTTTLTWGPEQTWGPGGVAAPFYSRPNQSTPIGVAYAVGGWNIYYDEMVMLPLAQFFLSKHYDLAKAQL